MIMHPYIAEFIGTAIILLLGAGVNANVSLKKHWQRQKVRGS